MVLRGVRNGGVDQRGVVLDEGVFPRLIQRRAAIDVSCQEAGADKIRSPPTPITILRGKRSTSANELTDFGFSQLMRHPTASQKPAASLVRLVDDLGVRADGVFGGVDHCTLPVRDRRSLRLKKNFAALKRAAKRR